MGYLNVSDLMSSSTEVHLVGPDEFQVEVHEAHGRSAQYVRLTREVVLSCTCGEPEPCEHVLVVGAHLEREILPNGQTLSSVVWSPGKALAHDLMSAIVRAEVERDGREDLVSRLFELRRQVES